MKSCALMKIINRISNAKLMKFTHTSYFGGIRLRIMISGRVNKIRPPSSAGMGSKFIIPSEMLMLAKKNNTFAMGDTPDVLVLSRTHEYKSNIPLIK
jgi:hypothetical protein